MSSIEQCTEVMVYISCWVHFLAFTMVRNKGGRFNRQCYSFKMHNIPPYMHIMVKELYQCQSKKRLVKTKK